MDESADQVAATEKKAPMESNSALELALMFAMLAAHGIKDTTKYRETLTDTFTQSIEGFGYKIVPK